MAEGNTRTIAVVIGAGLLGAGVVGLIWVLAGGGDDSSASADTTPITAPQNLAGYPKFADVPIMKSPQGRQVIAHRLILDSKTAAAVSKAYGGAGAIAVEYADPAIDLVPLLVAVRGPTPKPWFPTEDLALEKVVKPANEVKQVGDVTCVIHNTPTPAGKKPGPQSATIQSCMRSGPKLTVQVTNTGGFSDPAQVAQLVDAAWTQLSG